MKFGADVLLQIVTIVREGLVEGKDVSQMLREVDVEVDPGTMTLVLSPGYASSWKERHS
jgi:hypothetical protein